METNKATQSKLAAIDALIARYEILVKEFPLSYRPLLFRCKQQRKIIVAESVLS
jgi:hypothetical protein